MDYTSEPQHSALLNIQDSQPFNAEPSASDLVEFALTPEDLVYCRNHGPVREFDETSYSLTIRGGSKGEVVIPFNDLKTNFTVAHVVAALQVSCIVCPSRNVCFDERVLHAVCRDTSERNGSDETRSRRSVVRRRDCQL